jgi:hypothetical protein
MLTTCAVFCASSRWILRGESARILLKDREHGILGIFTVAAGTCVLPPVCAVLLIWIFSRLLTERPRPYSLLLFVGYTGLAFAGMFAPLGDSSNVVTGAVIAMCCASILSVVEVACRALWIEHLFTALLSLAVSFGSLLIIYVWYVHVLAGGL